MSRHDIGRIADALERIAAALEQSAQRPARASRERRDDDFSGYSRWMEAITDNADALKGRMTMDEVLDALGTPHADRGTRLSVGFALRQLGIRRGRSADQRFYVFGPIDHE